MPIMLALRRNRRQIRRKVANHRNHRFGVILPTEIDLRRHIPGLLQAIEQGQNMGMRGTRFEKPLARLPCLRHASQPQWRLTHCQINPINTVSLGLVGEPKMRQKMFNQALGKLNLQGQQTIQRRCLKYHGPLKLLPGRGQSGLGTQRY